MRIWIADEVGRSFLPDGLRIGVLARPDSPFPGDPGDVEFWVPPFLANPGVLAVPRHLPGLKVIQLLSAGVDNWAGHVPDGVTLCDARGAHDASAAEWVVTAILTALRRFDYFARAQAQRRWAYHEAAPTEGLLGKRVLIIGMGSIGAALAKRLEPFEVDMRYVARTARPGVAGPTALPRLLPWADIVVLLVPLTTETRGLVDAKFLASLGDGALLVNASRGAVVDTARLTAELSTGRIRAAVDVTGPEPLPTGHPLWTLPNALITPHVGGSVHGLLPRAYRFVGDQVRRFLSGEQLANEVRNGY